MKQRPHPTPSPADRPAIARDARRQPSDRPGPSPEHRCRRPLDGFTLIELLVVISIISLLIAILLPVLGSARDAAHAVNSLANTRSWGQGTHLFLNDHDFVLPWEGEKRDIIANYPEEIWRGNAVPPYVGQRDYFTLYSETRLVGKPVPQPPDKNIFVDPSAEVGPEQEGGADPALMAYYFSYVVNADLAEGDPRAVVEIDGYDRTYFDAIEDPAVTVMFFELRSGAHELSFLSPGDPGYSEVSEQDLLRMKGDEKHFAGRHFEGGHIAFADGHARHVKWLESFTGSPKVRWEVNSDDLTGD
jgi:prepilin-type N-terminal cleavage/methylation domain-containing protein/prepilin-type processing-associated H-X9-DG protein